MKNQIVRVGVSNNFGFSKEENKSLATFKKDGRRFFVNSNSFEKIKSDYPSFITINPYLKKFQKPVGDLSNVKAFRIKLMSNSYYESEILKAIDFACEMNIPILATMMRFASHKSIDSFVYDKKDYKFTKNYFRLTDDAKKAVIEKYRNYAKNKYGFTKFYICDESGKGCPKCGNCMKLSYNTKNAEIASLNLSASGNNGFCQYKCPDCFARRITNYIGKLCTDKVYTNNKQVGYKRKSLV